MSHHIVEAKELGYTYPDGTPAVSGVSFRISHGESVAIVGENGAGKSTLLLHMNGSLMPTSGSLRIGDLPVSKNNLNSIRRTVGMVFQNPDDQLFMPTVFDDVAFGLLNMGYGDREAEAKVSQALDIVGAGHLAIRPPFKLSQGEKRAASIAAVIAMSPDILVMDEPSSSLDPKSRSILIRLLKTFKHTKIIATHDLDLAMDVCERTIVMHKGRVAADRQTREIFNDDLLLSNSSLEKPLRMQGV